MIKEERFLAQINRIGDGIGVNISSETVEKVPESCSIESYFFLSSLSAIEAS